MGQKERKCRRLGLAIIAGSLVVLFGAIFGRKSDIFPQTLSPLAPSYLQPTTYPSAAPTSAFGELFDDLPKKTQERIYLFGSHQNQAWIWLQSHGKAPSYPLWRQKQLFALATFYYAFEGGSWPAYAKSEWLTRFVEGRALGSARDRTCVFWPGFVGGSN